MMPLNYFPAIPNNVDSYYTDFLNIQLAALPQIYNDMLQQLDNPNFNQQQKMLILASKGSWYLKHKLPLIRFERAQYMSPEELDWYSKDIDSELNYLTSISQQNLLDNFENMFIFLRNAFKLDELIFFKIALSLGVGVTKPYDQYYMDACAILGFRPIYYKPTVAKTTPIINAQLPIPAHESFKEQLILPENNESDKKFETVINDNLSDSDLLNSISQQSSESSGDINDVNLVEQNTSMGQHPTDLLDPPTFLTEESTEEEIPEVDTQEVETSEVDIPEVDTTEVETAEVETTEVETSEVETSEVEQSEVVGEIDLQLAMHENNTHPAIATPEIIVQKISNAIPAPTITQIVATLDVKKINDYMEKNPTTIKKVLSELQVKICKNNNLPKKLIMGLNCEIDFFVKLLSQVKDVSHKQVIISKICKYADSHFYSFVLREHINIKKLHLTSETRKEYDSRLAIATKWFAEQELKLLKIVSELPKSSDLNNVNLDLFVATKNSQQQSLLSLAIQKNLGAKTIQTLIRKSPVSAFHSDGLNLHPICYWALHMPNNLSSLQEMWQQYTKLIPSNELNNLLELAVDSDGNNLLHNLVSQSSPALAGKTLNKLFQLPNNLAIYRLLLIPNNYNQTPLGLACKKSKGWEEVVDCILNMLVNVKEYDGQTKFVLDKTFLDYYIKNNMLEKLFKIIEAFDTSETKQLSGNLDKSEEHLSNREVLYKIFKDAKLRSDLLELIKKENNAKVEVRFRMSILPLFPINLTINCSLAWIKLKAFYSGEKSVTINMEDCKELRGFIDAAFAVEKSSAPKAVFDGRLYILNPVLLCNKNIQLPITKFLVVNCGLTMTDKMCAYVIIQDNPYSILEYVLQQRMHEISKIKDDVLSKRQENAFVLRLYLTVTLLVPSENKIRWLLDNKYDYKATLIDGNNILHHAVYLIKDGDAISEEMYDALDYLLQQDNVFADLHHAKNKGQMNAMQTMVMFRKENPMLAGPFEEFKRFMTDVAIDHYNPCFLRRPKWCRTSPRNMLTFSMAGLATTTMLGIMLVQAQMEHLKLKM